MDIEWRCGCGHTNPDFDERCNGCGEERYEDEEAQINPNPPCFYCGAGTDCHCAEELNR